MMEEARVKAYKEVFATPAGKVVLQDLARFCRASRSTFDADPRVHALLEGRRECWLRIQQHRLPTLTGDDNGA